MMGAVEALLICVLTSWLTNGLCLPYGSKNEIEGNVLNRKMGELFPDDFALKKALGLIHSVESVLKEHVKEVLLETNEVEAEVLVGLKPEENRCPPCAVGVDVTLDGAVPGNVTLDGSARGNVTLDGSAGGNVTLDGSAGGNVTLDGAVQGNVTLDGSSAANVTLDGAVQGNVTLDGSSAAGGNMRIKRSKEPVEVIERQSAVRGGSEDNFRFRKHYQVPSR
nr:PREDICTED: uncharacterized protein LOC109627158 isoform X4 [Paralichthys olivaceus]